MERSENPLGKPVTRSLAGTTEAVLILTIGFYMMAARVTETTRTDLDAPAGTKVIDSLRR